MLTLFELCGGADRTDIRFSPFVWRIRLMLAHKGLTHDSKFITFADKSALEGTGFKTVPVIQDGETWVNESFRIARYLDDTYPENPLFETPLAAEQAILINNWFDRSIIMPIFPMIVTDIFDALDDDNKAAFRASREPRLGGRKIEDMRDGREELRAGLAPAFGPLEAIFERNAFLSGTAPAFADHCLMGSLMWPRVVTDFDPILASEPLKAWRERMLDQFDGLARRAPRAV